MFNSAPIFQHGYANASTYRRADPATLQHLQGQTMGTTWSVKIANPHMLALPAIRLTIDHILAQIIQQMSPWLENSEISIFNNAKPNTWHTVSGDFITVLECALHWARLSQGAFDPSVGALVNAWGFGPHTEPARSPPHRLPAPTLLQNIKKLTGFGQLKIQPKTQQIWQAGNIHLDFSAIAKGFAVDQVCTGLQTLGIEGALVEIGGDLRAYGLRPDQQPWRATIEPHLNSPASQPHTAAMFAPCEKPVQSDRPKIALTNLAIATSGDCWHVFEHQNRRYSHTIDPRTGAPIQHALTSVSVAHPVCMQADALATLLLVLGPAEGWNFATAHGLAALFVTQAENQAQPIPLHHMTPQFAALHAAS